MSAKVLYISDEEYFARPSIDQSQLKQFMRNPAEWAWARLHPEEHKATDAMRFGTAFHAYLLCTKGVVSLDEGEDFRKAENREWRDEQIEAGRLVVSHEEMQRLERMYANIARYPEYMSLIENGTAEVAIEWEDKETGLALKAKPDLIPQGTDFLVDLKTASSAAPGDFMRESYKYGYHIQAQFYRQAVAMCSPGEFGRGSRIPDAMQFWVFEKTGACDWSPYSLSSDNPMMHTAGQAIRQALRGIALYVRRGEEAGLGEGLDAAARWALGTSKTPNHGYGKVPSEIEYSDWALLDAERSLTILASAA